MFSSNLTSRILKEAQTRGLIGESPSAAGRGAGPAGDREADYWGTELASLVASGRMPAGTLHTLAWEAIGGEAGSWVDPLFKGPAPIGELKGLGDRYQDLVPVGEGASAWVYKGMDTLLQRHVAIKTLKDPRGPILEEARAQAKVEHPNVCRVYEVGRGYLVMQLVEGPTLAQMAHALDLPEKVRIIRDIAQGVHAAHVKGLIHLDLKLNNVLMEKHGDGIMHPVISDFGMVAGATGAGGSVSLGTPPYTSPEQLARDAARLGPGADVYALGVMLYVLLANAIPFEAHDFGGLLEAMASAPPVPLRRKAPQVPRDLEAIVAKCMEKRPENRYGTARDLGEDLDRFLRGEPLAVMGGSLTYRLGKWLARNRKLQWVGAASLVILLVSLGGFTRNLRFAAQQAEWDIHSQKVVSELEAHLDRAYRLPAHDIRPDLQRASGFVEKIEEARRRGGSAAQGPAFLALGQAHLLLDGNDSRAVLDFQKAWDLGYRTESARSWLAISRLATFRDASWKFVPGLLDKANSGRADEVRRMYLEPARNLLRGKGSPDQARLLFLVDLADVKTLDPNNFDRWLRVVQAYRSQFPNDLDGLFEEAMAYTYKGTFLLAAVAQKQGSSDAIDLPEAEAFRRKGRELLEELQRTAPSMPKVYGALAEACIRENGLPTAETPSTSELFAKAQDWLDQGLQVRGDDPVLIASYATFLGEQVAKFRLASGQDPGPVANRLLALRAPVASDPEGTCLKALVDAAAAFLATCRYYGVPPPPGLREALGGWIQASLMTPAPGFERLVHAARALAQGGGDPLPIIQRLQERPPPETPPELYMLGSVDLTAAELIWSKQGDPVPWIARAQDLLARMGQDKHFRTALSMEILAQRARLVGDEAAWSDLRRQLAEMGPAGPAMPVLAIDTAVEFNALLARKAQAGNADPGPWVREIQRCLLETEIKDYAWTPFFHEHQALCHLLGALGDRDPMPRLLQALDQADQALRKVSPPRATGHPGTVRLRPGNFPDYPAALARIQSLKAEILLALAKAERRANPRIRLARAALDLLNGCLKRDPHLERSLQPLIGQARNLSRT